MPPRPVQGAQLPHLYLSRRLARNGGLLKTVILLTRVPASTSPSSSWVTLANHLISLSLRFLTWLGCSDTPGVGGGDTSSGMQIKPKSSVPGISKEALAVRTRGPALPSQHCSGPAPLPPVPLSLRSPCFVLRPLTWPPS